MNTRLIASTLAVALALGAVADGQSLDERLDDDRFLRGLVDLDVPEILDHYLASHASADPAHVKQLEIAAARRELQSTAPGTKERVAALDRVLELRGEEILRHPNHPQRALWLADQAADLFLEMLPIDASGLATLYGLPSRAQRERARYVAGRMNGLAVQAELEIHRAILDLESMPGYESDETLRAQRRRLARDERDRRIPFLRGVAAGLYAEIVAKTDVERREHYDIAIQMLEPLAGQLSGLPARRARLYCGLAMVRRGRYGDGEALFRRVVGDEAASPADIFAARVGVVISRTRQEDARSGLATLDAIEPLYVGRENFYFRVLLADHRFLIRREASEAERVTAADHPVNVYLALLDRERDLPRDTVLAIVLDKIAEAVTDIPDLRELPVIATIARADRLSREERRRSEAVMLFESALKRTGAEDGDHAAALFGLARTLHAMNRHGAAARRFLELAERHPEDREAERAIELAVSILRQLSRENPRDDRVREAFDHALDVLFENYGEMSSIGRWRYVAGKAALEEGDLAGALAHFDMVAPDAGDYLDAQFMRVNVIRAGAAHEADPAERRRAHEALAAASEEAIQRVERGLLRVTGKREQDLLYYMIHLRVFHAEAQLALGEHRAAIETLRGIEREPGVDEAALADALRIRIDAFQALGRAEAARGEILRFLAAAPEQSGAVLDSMVAGTLRAVDALLAQGRSDEAHDMARTDGVPLATLLAEWIGANATEPDVRDRYLTHVATVYRLSGRFEEGLRIYDRLIADHPDTVEILFGRAECLFGLGPERLADAMTVYKRLASAGPAIGHTYYWQSQLRMLLVLDRVQKNTDKIVPRINRLKMGDETLGGTRFKPQFERLANKYS